MPLYEYRCSSCGEMVEVLQRSGDPPPTECTRCGGTMLKVISAPAIQFKGSGWYVTDYARAGKKDKEAPPSAPSEPAKPASESKPSPSAPTKPSS